MNITGIEHGVDAAALDVLMAEAFAAMREGQPNGHGISGESYAQLIADEFIRIRGGGGLCLSSTDTQLIDDWYRAGIPVHLPLRALAQVEEWRAKKPAVKIRGLSYIREEVDASFAELLEGHVGCGGCEKSYCSKRAA